MIFSYFKYLNTFILIILQDSKKRKRKIKKFVRVMVPLKSIPQQLVMLSYVGSNVTWSFSGSSLALVRMRPLPTLNPSFPTGLPVHRMAAWLHIYWVSGYWIHLFGDFWVQNGMLISLWMYKWCNVTINFCRTAGDKRVIQLPCHDCIMYTCLRSCVS